SRAATGSTCSRPVSARTSARLPDRKAAPILPPMALRLAIEECRLTTRHPFAIARGSTTGYRRVWVRVIDEEGLEGWGEADPSSYYGETYDTVRATIERLAPHLPRDPFDLEGAEDCFRGVAPTQTAAARAALSAALHDLCGKRLGQPLWRLWGLDPRKAPRSSFTIGLGTPEQRRASPPRRETCPWSSMRAVSSRRTSRAWPAKWAASTSSSPSAARCGKRCG